MRKVAHHGDGSPGHRVWAPPVPPTGSPASHRQPLYDAAVGVVSSGVDIVPVSPRSSDSCQFRRQTHRHSQHLSRAGTVGWCNSVYD